MRFESKFSANRYHLEHILNNDIDYPTFFPASEKYNFTGYSQLMVPTLKNLSTRDWFAKQSGQWNELYEAPFAELLTTRGFGFAFNLLNASDLYKTDQ